jgi:hypothetical protein
MGRTKMNNPLAVVAKRDAVARKLSGLQDALYTAGLDGENPEEVERLRGQVLATLNERETLDRLIAETDSHK